ncbi:MAG TPA: dihydrolipoyl dehydrogenase [Candidatus Thermoplasmatota archaeon]|nr:dihydrolipoyl dehydrogenase [Candidatus Thermoplasmatota archaeon]
MSQTTDVLVLGAGPGGYVAAIRAAQLGKKVVLVEKDRLGGVCLNVGCIPSKALIHAAKTLHRLHDASEMGITAKPSLDVGQLQKWKDGVVSRLTGGIGQLCKANGVEVLTGEGRFTGPQTVEVRATGGTKTVQFQHAIVATGSRPVEIPGFSFDGKTVLSSTEALALREVPRNLAVIGGGVIGLELGMAYAALGSKVTVVELLDQLLPGTDPELVRPVEKRMRALGMAWHLRAKAKGHAAGVLEVELSDGKVEKIPADRILLSVGRRPNSETLGLDKAGVKVDAKGFVPVNEKRQTSNPAIFAIGDLAGPPMLAHKASQEGIVAAEVIAGKPAAWDKRAVPGVIFTDPEVATAGLTEAEAKAKGLTVRVGRFPFAASGRAMTTRETDGFVKIVADARTDVVLGVHVVGPEASDLISEAALAIEMGATLEDLAATVHPHPTLPEAIMEAAEAAHGKAIHTINRSS